MPGRFFLQTPLSDLAAPFAARLEVAEPGPRPDAAPGEQVAVLRADVQGLRLSEMRWSMILSGRVNARRRPVMETIVNARSETLFDKTAFQGVLRAVLPVNGWYEWTGTARQKTRWTISDPDQPVLYLAAIYDIWSGPGGIEVPQMATLTCAPNADLATIHHRMPVILSNTQVPVWLSADEPVAAALCRPWPAGRLRIERSTPPT